MHQPDVKLPLLYSGKVRDLYEIDADHMLIVASDRLSAFDVILPTPIPGKGAILTRMASFWFKKFRTLLPNHLDLATVTLAEALSSHTERERQRLSERSVVAKRLQPLPIEAIVRGYLIGSGWKDYCRNGRLCDIPLPSGLRQAEQLPEPLFTPSTKAASGSHDENISFADAAALLGQPLAEQVRDLSLSLYIQASAHARQRGIIIADTKFEFGLDQNRRLILIDEVLTPDSSRFWPVDDYVVGRSPPSLDKQFVRDYLETLDWDKRAPGPPLPDSVVSQTSDRYQRVWQQLSSP